MSAPVTPAGRLESFWVGYVHPTGNVVAVHVHADVIPLWGDRDHPALLPLNGRHAVTDLSPIDVEGEFAKHGRGSPPPDALGRQATTVGGMGEIASSRGLRGDVRRLAAGPVPVAGGELHA